MIAVNIFIVIWIHIVAIKYKKKIIIITLIILNSIFILSFTWVKISIDIEPLEFLQQFIIGIIMGIIMAICLAILIPMWSKRKKKRKIQIEGEQ